MISFSRAVALVILTLLFLSLGTNAIAADRTITVRNGTTTPMFSVRVARAGDRDWGPELLVNGGILPGRSVQVHFNDDDEICDYDVHVVFGDKREEVRHIDVCHGYGNAVTFEERA